VRLVLLGPPGAGKGTQAGALASFYAIPHIATGDIFRMNVRQETPLGSEAKAYMERGDLVPDEVVIGMVMDRLGAPDCSVGFLLDGFPRTVPQALALEDALTEDGRGLHFVLRFVLPDDEVVRRLASRRELEGRGDDAEGVVRHRLDEYHSKTEPLEFFYWERGILRDVEAVGQVETVTQRALKVLDEFREAQDA
jgi:adenylate kinase